MTSAASEDFPAMLAALVPNLRAFGRSLTGSSEHADDLVQETLVKAWQSRQRFEEGSNLKAWLFTILRNTFLSERRKRKWERQDVDGDGAAMLVSRGEQLGHMDLLDFNTAFSGLPEDQKEALLLVGAEGFSYEEAAQMCGCAVGTMKSRVSRARTRLAALLGYESGNYELAETFSGEAVRTS